MAELEPAHLSKEDISSFAEEYHTDARIINQLVAGGIHPAHMREVMDTRDLLSRTYSKNPDSTGPINGVTVRPKALIYMYHVANGDITLMESLANEALYLIGKKVTPTKAASRVIRKFMRLGPKMFME